MNSYILGHGPKVLVCQHGARHRYAIPRMLEEAGMLAALYIDSSEFSLLGRLARFLGDWAPKRVRRLAGRRIEGINSKRIVSIDDFVWSDLTASCWRCDHNYMETFLRRISVESQAFIRRGDAGANIIYSMYHGAGPFVQWMKKRGVKSVVDVYISPIADRIMAREAEIIPEWGEGIQSQVTNDFFEKIWFETKEIADVLLCPSEFVAEGVREISPEAADKIRIVPYGCSIDYQGRVNDPVKGRVLFAGGDALRKGLHYLGNAATILKNTIPELEVRIAGSLPENVVRHPLCKDLHFLGKLTSQRMKEEYLSADVFVLPSLAEGFASVVAEAIGAGCPVIVTKESGSPVVHEREGLIIPSRDSEAIAGAMMRIISDRSFRSKCSTSALEQAAFYSEKEWQHRLVLLMKELS